jgi:hypothetical protein
MGVDQMYTVFERTVELRRSRDFVVQNLSHRFEPDFGAAWIELFLAEVVGLHRIDRLLEGGVLAVKVRSERGVAVLLDHAEEQGASAIGTLEQTCGHERCDHQLTLS